LVNIHGDELDMGTEFDSFDDRAYQSPDIPNLSQNVLQNRIILAGIMSIAGFTPLSTEWWHYHIRIYDEYPDYTNFPKLKRSDVDGYI
jgi:D-alanyl-D-alanine dipeptidase